MTDATPSYEQRRQAIAAILDPYLAVASMVPTNTTSAFEPGIFRNSLWCSWADDGAGVARTVSVSIHHVEDGGVEAARIREMMAAEAQTSGDPSTDADAYEISGQLPGEYVFVLDYLGDVTAIAGNCITHVMPSSLTASLADLAAPALEIARTVGCSPYVDDAVPPVLERSNPPTRWSTADGMIYDPRTPPRT
jgi:hypothetical protein